MMEWLINLQDLHPIKIVKNNEKRILVLKWINLRRLDKIVQKEAFRETEWILR